MIEWPNIGSCAGGQRLGAPAEALTSCQETIRRAPMAYDDLKRIVVDLGRIQGRSWNSSILNHPCAQATNSISLFLMTVQ